MTYGKSRTHDGDPDLDLDLDLQHCLTFRHHNAIITLLCTFWLSHESTWYIVLIAVGPVNCTMHPHLAAHPSDGPALVAFAGVNELCNHSLRFRTAASRACSKMSGLYNLRLGRHHERCSRHFARGLGRTLLAHRANEVCHEARHLRQFVKLAA